MKLKIPEGAFGAYLFDCDGTVVDSIRRIQSSAPYHTRGGPHGRFSHGPEADHVTPLTTSTVTEKGCSNIPKYWSVSKPKLKLWRISLHFPTRGPGCPPAPQPLVTATLQIPSALSKCGDKGVNKFFYAPILSHSSFLPPNARPDFISVSPFRPNAVGDFLMDVFRANGRSESRGTLWFEPNVIQNENEDNHDRGLARTGGAGDAAGREAWYNKKYRRSEILH